MVKTCLFCNWTKPRPDRSRVRGLWAEEIGDLIFLDHGSARIGDETFGFRIVLDGATSHLTANSCKSTSPSEVIDKVHEWMDTFQMNPKAICADMAFHQPHDMQVFKTAMQSAAMGVNSRISLSSLQTGPQILHGPTELKCVYDCSRNCSWHSWIQPPSQNLDQTANSGTDHSCTSHLMCKAATVRNTQVTLSGKTPMELAMGRRPRYLPDPASVNPEQFTSTPTIQGP